MSNTSTNTEYDEKRQIEYHEVSRFRLSQEDKYPLSELIDFFKSIPYQYNVDNFVYAIEFTWYNNESFGFSLVVYKKQFETSDAFTKRIDMERRMAEKRAKDLQEKEMKMLAFLKQKYEKGQ